MPQLIIQMTDTVTDKAQAQQFVDTIKNAIKTIVQSRPNFKAYAQYVDEIIIITFNGG